VTGNTHVFDRPRATVSVSSALLKELNITMTCLKVWRVRSMHVYVMRYVNRSSSFIVLQDVGISGAPAISLTMTNAAWRKCCNTR
jgi:hypothetical protein